MNPTAAAVPFQRSKLVWTLYLLLGLFSYALTMIGPAIPSLRQEFKLDYTMAALHLSMFALGMVIAGWFSPKISQRIGLFASLWGGMAGILLGAILLVLAPSPWLTLPAILVMSLFATLALTNIQSALSSLYPTYRSKALMEANVVASLASSSAPFLIVLGSMTALGWRILTPAFAIGLAATALFGWSATRHHGQSAAAKQPDAAGRLPPAYWVGWCLIFFCVAVEWCVGFWSTEYLQGLPGKSLSVAAAGTGVFQIASVAGRLISSRLTGKFSEIRMLIGAMILVALGFPLYWLRHDILTAFVGLALCGMGVSTFYPLALSQAVGASGQRVRQASSYAPIASGLAIGLAPLALGRLADGLSLSTALFAIPLGLGLMAMLLISRKLFQRPPQLVRH